MLSSICVATITGLPAARQARVSRFWIGGTWCTGSSTPRSPRATMMPSEASRISAKALTAAGFSILERIAARPSASSRASKTSVGRCTKESASQSTPSSQANSRSLRSLAESAASGSTTSGTLTPLRLEISPPTTTSVSGVLGRALDHLHPELAVVDEERRAGLERREDLRVRQADPGGVALGRVEVEAEARALGEQSPGRRRRCRTGASAPAGRRGCRSAGRARPRPGGPARGAGRCRRGCRGSC